MTNTKSNFLLNLFLTIMLIITFIAIWWFSQQSLPQNNTTTDEQTLPTVKCDFINSLCVSEQGAYKISLAIDSSLIQSFEPLPFRVTFTGFKVESASIDFQGIEMFMGSNVLALTKQPNEQFIGTHTLAGHKGYSMTWRAKVLFSEQGGDTKTQQVWFEFPLQ